MSTATLNSLFDYLCGTLSPDNMLWLANRLAEQAAANEQQPPFAPLTMKEIDNMLDEAERDFEAGDYLTHDEVFNRNQIAVPL